MSLLAMDSGVQTAVVTTAGGVLVALAGIAVELLRRQGNRLAEVGEHAQEAREQVANTHSTNLRDDLDRVLDALNEVKAELRGLRHEMAHERSERLAVAERLDDHVTATNR